MNRDHHSYNNKVIYGSVQFKCEPGQNKRNRSRSYNGYYNSNYGGNKAVCYIKPHSSFFPCKRIVANWGDLGRPHIFWVSSAWVFSDVKISQSSGKRTRSEQMAIKAYITILAFLPTFNSETLLSFIFY